MSSNAVAAIAVILVSGFAGCAATAKSAEPTSVPAMTPSQRASAMPVVFPAGASVASATITATSRVAEVRTLTITPDGQALYRRAGPYR